MTITMTSIANRTNVRARLLDNIRQACRDEQAALDGDDYEAWQKARLFRNRLAAALTVLDRGGK